MVLESSWPLWLSFMPMPMSRVITSPIPHPIPGHALQANNFIQLPACLRQGYVIIVVPEGRGCLDWSSQPSSEYPLPHSFSNSRCPTPSMPCRAQGPLPDVQVQLVCVDVINFTAEKTEMSMKLPGHICPASR